MKKNLSTLFAMLLLIACNNKDESPSKLDNVNQTIINDLSQHYDQLPEQEIIISEDYLVYAQYAMPTEKYGHAILGDKVEAEQLVVVADQVYYELILEADYVFEDISPRLYDVDADGELEFITIRTHVDRGAGIAIYKIIDNELEEYAFVPEIGTKYRWLNIVAINDLDNDGTVELVWIQTPHIGGILKVTKIEQGALNVLSEKEKYSNHAIGERNLCLSCLRELPTQKVLYVPNQSRDKIIGFTFQDNELEMYEEISLDIDFSQSLSSQYDFDQTIATGNNCFTDE